MKIYFESLQLEFKQSTELIEFKDFNYFFGEIGAGKSSIVRIIDFCLGDKLTAITPALQSEFIEATLNLIIKDIPVSLTRQIKTNKITATWYKNENALTVIVPARDPEGEIIPNTGVENISDLIFYLSDLKPPKVRRSKINEDSDLGRLSFRDLYWYCYLDQENIDNDFFHLGRDAHDYKRYKSKDVLRYILGFHQEEVSDLEIQLEELRHKKMSLQESSKILQNALSKLKLGSVEEIQSLISFKRENLIEVEAKLKNIRVTLNQSNAHAVEDLRKKGRDLAFELSSLEEAIKDVENVIKSNEKHLNELNELSLKLKRMLSARTVLNDVNFILCPRCTQRLPERTNGECTVCGQNTTQIVIDEITYKNFEKDKDDRIKEIESILFNYNEELKKLQFDYEHYLINKKRNDLQLSEALRDYDSIYLSQALVLEQNKASIEQEITEYEKLIQLPEEVINSLNEAEEIKIQEVILRDKLNGIRKLAELDVNNLKRLEELFLDSLLQSKVPGFSINDKAIISSPHFMPIITNPKTGDLVYTSFENLGSGGKKTLFKSCFLIAIHRLVKEIEGNLPTLIIIDSPMKNISERENKPIFDAFYQFLYNLSQNELDNTQFIIVDKEFFKPQEDYRRTILFRHMKPNSNNNPPLIPYYRS